MESKSETSTKPINVWTALNSINSRSHREWSEIEEVYEPFIINRALSYFRDTIMDADEMNRFSDVPKKAQYIYYINRIRPGKRFTEWGKKKFHSDFMLVQEHFKYSNRKTEAALKILTRAQIDAIKQKKETGGVK